MSQPETPWRALCAWVVALACLQLAPLVATLLHVHWGRALAVLALAAAAGVALSPRGVRGWGWVPLGMVLLVEGVFALTAPDASSDGNMYHLPALNAWLREGAVTWIELHDFDIFANGYAKGPEAVAMVFVAAFGDGWGNVAQLAYAPLGVFAVAALALRLGAAPRAAWVAGGLWLVLPPFVAQVGTTYVDGCFAAAAAAALAAFVEADARARAGASAWSALSVTALAVGLAWSAKGTGVVLLALVGAAWLGLRARRWRLALGGAALIAGGALLVAGFWYGRNWLRTGSPLFPVGVSVIGHQIFPGISVEQAIYEGGNTPPELLAWPAWARPLYTWAQGFGRWPQSVVAHDTRLGGLGWLWLVGCVPSLVWCVWRRRGRALTLLALLIMALFVAAPMRWWARYTWWLYALGLPCLAVVLDAAWVARRKLVGAWLLACVVLLAIENVATWSWRAQQWRLARAGGPLTADAGFAPLLTGRDDVALPPFGDDDRHEVVGWLGHPLGARRLLPVPEDVGPGGLRGARWLVTGDSREPSPALRTAAKNVTHAGRFWLLDFGVSR